MTPESRETRSLFVSIPVSGIQILQQTRSAERNLERLARQAAQLRGRYRRLKSGIPTALRRHQLNQDRTTY